jgi:hypothetical protein
VSILRRLVAVAGAFVLLAPGSSLAASECPISYGSADNAKPNKVYLYFPAVADATFPEYGGAGFETSPADPFDISQLSGYSGTEAALKGRIKDVVTDDFCEFNAQVRQTTTAPPATFARRALVAIGTDDNSTGRWGRADVVDSGDTLPLGFARVWAGRYQNDGSTAPGGALEGANSTVERWGNAIGGTAAHEAGHTYGVFHETSLNPGEDTPLGRHVMPAGSDVNSEQRAGYRRHFSDTSFSVLAANIGLSIQTMHNWDLVNPNAQTAHRFRLTFLSPQSSPVMSWAYTGPSSPWNSPTLTANGTQSFKGTTYNRFRLTWSDDANWNGGPDGQVPGGGDFHVGATFSGVDFNQPDPIIITDSQLLDASGDPLALKPRLPGYDAGETSVEDGVMSMDFAAFNNVPLRLQDVTVRELPRVLSIGSMVRNRPLRDPFGQRFRPWPGGTRKVNVRGRGLIRRKRGLSVPLARMSDDRPILEEVDPEDCDADDAPNGLPDAARCGGTGFVASLFPSTTLLVTADVVTPNAKVWNPRRKRYVRRALKNRIWVQVGGRRPDFNRNGLDDAIDIDFGGAPDRDEDGVPDQAQR